MQISSKVQKFIHEKSLFSTGDTLVVGVSGGMDSMLLAWILKKLGYHFIIAHCNFQLRGEESEGDEELVRHFASNLDVPFFSIRFDTLAYCSKNKASIQVAARELRYAWFEKLRMENNCNAIAVAHHAQDHIETALINLSRGTGLLGLTGIKPKRDHIVRPLLCLSRNEIEQVVSAHDIPFRNDSSNASTKYARNKIRLDILPEFRKLNQEFDQIMIDNMQRLDDAYQLLEHFVSPIRKQLFLPNENGYRIKKSTLEPWKKNRLLLHELFRPFGFDKSTLEVFAQTERHIPGTIFESATHRLWIDREMIFLIPWDSDTMADQSVMSIREIPFEIEIGDQVMKGSAEDDAGISTDPYIATLDFAKLKLPLVLRYWRKGDKFTPLGMKSQQKLSDFFIQQKVPLHQKIGIPILINGDGDIIWIAGMRISDQFKITKNTNKVIKFVYEQRV